MLLQITVKFYSMSIAILAVMARRKRGIPGSKGSTAKLAQLMQAMAWTAWNGATNQHTPQEFMSCNVTQPELVAQVKIMP